MARFPSFEVAPEDPCNPFRAVVISSTSEGHYDQGKIRIEPPFTPGGELLDSVGSEERIFLGLWASGPKATILAYEQEEGSETRGDDRERIEHTTQVLLKELGGLACVDLI